MCSLITMSGEECQFQKNQSSDGTIWGDYENFITSYIPDAIVPMISYIPIFEYHPWLFSMIGSTVIGLSGIFPLFVIPIEEGANLKSGAGARSLRVMLSFAVGCLLGDVFLHLLPEVWTEQSIDAVDPLNGHPSMNKGLWVLAGLLVFIILEKVFTSMPGSVDFQKPSADINIQKVAALDMKLSNGYVLNNNVKELINGYANGHSPNLKMTSAFHEVKSPVITAKSTSVPEKSSPIKVSGYLNLMANSFDNFTHGLAVGGSFLVSFPHGVLTTLAILLHEIPHEVGDFAILLRSGFSRWDAARAQLVTASTGIMGALTAVALSGATTSVEARTSWILPFTAGGFLHIALVTVLPDLLQEESPRESLLHIIFLLGGIGVMAGLIVLGE